jgi:hypothetical protein
MQKFYWYKTILKCDVKSFKDHLLASSFDPETGKGFNVYTIKPNLITARYIQSKTIIDEVETPLGIKEISERLVYEYIDFELLGDNYQLLELKNPARCLKSFLNSLQVISGFELTIEQLNLPIPYLLGKLKDSELKVLKINEMELANITFDKNINGNINIKGKLDINSYEDKLNIKSDHIIKRAKVEVIESDVFGTIELFSNCKIIISDRIYRQLLPKIRNIFKNHIKV